jgi:fermentation-respiration switch protein FrsA (DUF1100 family)
MRTEECTFNVDNERLMATKVYASSEEAPNVISFHGTGSTASRGSIRYILDYLAGHGISSLCFDFSGHGESTGKLEQSTLSVRKKEAEAATKLLSTTVPPVIIGTSMGAYLAALVTTTIEPRALILFCPAAYPEDVMHVKFGESFTALVRRPAAYANSPAFRALNSFKGTLLIVGAKRDAVIPPGVIDLYADSALLARDKKVIWVEQADHKIHTWLQRHEEQKATIQRDVLAAAMAGHPRWR